MIEHVINILSILSGLLGIYFGFLLSERASRRKENKEENLRNESVRLIINLELKTNQDKLKNYYASYLKFRSNFSEILIGTDSKKKAESLNKLAYSISTEPAPSVSFKAWESQLHLLSYAYALDKQKLLKIYNYYSDLLYFLEIRNSLADFKDDMDSFFDKMEKDSLYKSQNENSSPYVLLVERFEETLNKLLTDYTTIGISDYTK